MSDVPPPAPSRRARLLFAGTLLGTAVLTVLVLLLLQNISERKRESRESVFRLVEVTEETVDPAEWGKNFPRQYDGYRRTVDTERTRHGGSDAFQKLDEDPRWRVLFEGYAFGVDYREERGHAYMLSDQDMSDRVARFPQPGACLHCHASVIPAYRAAGRAAAVPDNRPGEQVMKGFERVCALPYAEARKLVSHPVTCLDCHDPSTMRLRVTRPAFLEGIGRLAASDAPVPHLPSVERWRRGRRAVAYDPNSEATRQELRSFVCGQCHVEYYFRGEGKLLTYPWHRGIRVEEVEAHYADSGHADWTHPRTGAALLKAQHPEFETWGQGIHARSGVACADCHMPYVREGAVKVSDHHVRSPLLNVARACQVCHRYPEAEILARAATIQDRTKALLGRAEEAVLALVRAIEEARAGGAGGESLAPARDLHRRAQWRLDFVAAENSMGFHAPQECARILAEAADLARQGEVAAVRALAARGR
ncbi:MAG: ammonia-forming cytochrome c nitrite reductase subunit c552 [Planctomycetales bacterium]|nr:ammonia-forming cytochrome c nitrite reductase subunit c552 [Planctomycetales bacterium]